MTCAQFEAFLAAGPLPADALAHMRSCSACLETAVAADPENLFRSLGGEDLEPSGGIDQFVADVVQQVHLREAETRLTRRREMPAAARWSIAAALAVGVAGSSLLYRPSLNQAPVVSAPAVVASQVYDPSMTLPVVEEYSNGGATIVEMASDSDLTLVMIFDESLPVDL